MKNPCKICDKACPDGGCKAWRDWFVQNWNDNITIAPQEPRDRQFFRYEHPDLVREGIAYGKGNKS